MSVPAMLPLPHHPHPAFQTAFTSPTPPAQHLPRLARCPRTQCLSAWRAPKPESCTEKILSPACGGRGSHEKNARIFFMGTREGGRRPEGGGIKKPGFIPPAAARRTRTAWRRAQYLRRLADPAFTPLGGPSIYAAWRGQHLRRLARPAFTPLGEPSNYAAWRGQHLRRLAGPVFTPLGGASIYAAWRGQHLRRLAVFTGCSPLPALLPASARGRRARSPRCCCGSCGFRCRAGCS